MRAWLAVALVALVSLAASVAEAQYTAGCVIVATSPTTIGCSSHLAENAVGVGLGTTAPDGRLQITDTFRETANGEYKSLFLWSEVDPPADAAGSFSTVHAHLDKRAATPPRNFTGALTTGLFDPHYAGPSTYNTIQAVLGNPQMSAGGFATYVRGVRSAPLVQDSSTYYVEAFSAQLQSVGASWVQQAYGLQVYDPGVGNGEGIQTYFGVRVRPGRGLVKWSFYADSDPSYFGGGLTIQGDLVRPLEPNGYACWSGGRLVSSSVAC